MFLLCIFLLVFLIEFWPWSFFHRLPVWNMHLLGESKEKLNIKKGEEFKYTQWYKALSALAHIHNSLNSCESTSRVFWVVEGVHTLVVYHWPQWHWDQGWTSLWLLFSSRSKKFFMQNPFRCSVKKRQYTLVPSWVNWHITQVCTISAEH